MNIKLSTLTVPTVVIAALLMITFHSVAMASPGEHCDKKQMSHEQINPEKMHEQMKDRLDKLAERLEIKSSQQAVWEEFAQSVEMLAEQHVKKPNDEADAATISRYQAERATEFSKKLAKIAGATAKLQTALTEDQRKILNQASHRFLHRDHGWNHKNHERNRECHELDQRGSSDMEGHHDDHNKDSK